MTRSGACARKRALETSSFVLTSVSLTLISLAGLLLARDCLGDEPPFAFSRGDVRAEVKRSGITLVDESSEVVASWSSLPWEVKDCAAKPSGGVLFLILGPAGASQRSTTGARLAVLSIDGRRIEEILVDKDRGQNPWKIRAADIDGDGQTEVCVGVSIKAGSGETRKKCLHVYGWDGRGLFPKWLGSKLSMPFMDFGLCDTDADGQVELVSLEAQKNGLARVMVYRWRGFGFEGVTELESDLDSRMSAPLDCLIEENGGGPR